jgi:putative heme transporter
MGLEAARLHGRLGGRPGAALVPPRDRPTGRGRTHDRAGTVPRRVVVRPQSASRAAGRRARPADGLALVLGLVALATVSVVEQFDELRSAVSRAVDDIAGQLQGEPIGLSTARTDELESSLGDAWREASGYAAAGVQTGAGLVAGLVLAVAMLYFVLRDGAALWTAILRSCSPEVRPATDRAGRRAWEVLGGFVRGTAMVATIDAVLIGIGLWLLDVPLAFALAVLVFMGSSVP